MSGWTRAEQLREEGAKALEQKRQESKRLQAEQQAAWNAKFVAWAEEDINRAKRLFERECSVSEGGQLEASEGA